MILVTDIEVDGSGLHVGAGSAFRELLHTLAKAG